MSARHSFERLGAVTERTPDDPTYRSIDLTSRGNLRFEATNRRGGVLAVGSGEDSDFTPVELLLVALAGCGAIDLEHITRKRAAFTSFAARAEGHKVRDEQGNHLVDLRVVLDVAFPQGEGGDAAREVLPRALRQIEERLCAVGRTVQLGDPVRYVAGQVAPPAEDASPVEGGPVSPA